MFTVSCPILEDHEDLDADCVRESVFNFKRGFVCQCTLRIVHSSEDDIGEFQNIDLGTDSKTNWPNLKRRYIVLRKNTVISMEVWGNCCWEIHAMKGHNGEKKELYRGDPFNPEFQPISIRKVNCPYAHYEY